MANKLVEDIYVLYTKHTSDIRLVAACVREIPIFLGCFLSKDKGPALFKLPSFDFFRENIFWVSRQINAAKYEQDYELGAQSPKQ